MLIRIVINVYSQYRFVHVIRYRAIICYFMR
jgi:hypothetical protein